MLFKVFPPDVDFFQILCNDTEFGSAKSALMQTQLAFSSLSQIPKKSCYGQVIFVQITPHNCTFVPALHLALTACLTETILPESMNRSALPFAAFYETKNANFISVFLCARELLQSVSPRSHYPLCKNWAWPQHGFLISFRAKTRLILLVMSCSSRSAVAVRAACGRGVTRCV